MAKRLKYNLPEVEHIELSEKHIKLRTIAAVIMAAIAAVMLVYFFMQLIGTDPGWQVVESSAKADSCAAEFVFQYEFGSDATIVHKQLKSLYTELTTEAYKIFNSDTSFEHCYNLRYLNLNPNKEIEIDPTLYEAFEKVLFADSRIIYLAPIWDEYLSIFFSNTDYEAESFDPSKSPEQAEFIETLSKFTSSDFDVKLELLGDNKVKLNVSNEYLTFAKENGIDTFLDFCWLQNAVISDYIADRLILSGFTKGILTSFDGCVRNLGANSLNHPIYDRIDNTVYRVSTAHFDGQLSLVNLRDFMLNPLDFQHYYEYSDGTILHPYLNSNGYPQNSISNLIAFSKDYKCTDLMLNASKAYIADTFDSKVLKYGFIYCKEYTLFSSGDLTLSELYSDEKVAYTKAN